MFFAKTVLSHFKEVEIEAPVFKQKRVSLQCECGEQMSFAEKNQIEVYFCNACGFSIKSQKEIEKPQENTVHLGKVKSKVTAIVMEKQALENKDLEKVINLYLLLRKAKGHRSKRLIGDLAACLSFTLNKPKKIVAATFNIGQKFVSGGLNLISRVINNFQEFDLKSECENHLRNFAGLCAGDFPAIKIPLKLILFAARYNVGRSIPTRTRSAGALWFYLKATNYEITDREFINKLGMQKETFTKFFKELILTMHQKGRHDGKFQNKIDARRKALLSFMKKYKLQMPKMSRTLKVVEEWREKYIIAL